MDAFSSSGGRYIPTGGRLVAVAAATGGVNPRSRGQYTRIPCIDHYVPFSPKSLSSG